MKWFRTSAVLLQIHCHPLFLLFCLLLHHPTTGRLPSRLAVASTVEAQRHLGIPLTAPLLATHLLLGVAGVSGLCTPHSGPGRSAGTDEPGARPGRAGPAVQTRLLRQTAVEDDTARVRLWGRAGVGCG